MGNKSSAKARKAFKAQSGSVEEAIRDIFFRADTNGNGVLEVQELVKMFTDLEINMPEQELYSLMSAVDVDKNGSVSVDEFLNWIFERKGKGSADLPGERWCPRTHPRRGVLTKRGGLLHIASPSCSLCGQGVGHISQAWFCDTCKDDGTTYNMCNACFEGGAVRLSALRESGHTAGELRTVGFDAGELKAAGFLLAELKEGCFAPKELIVRDAFSAAEIIEVGYTLAECRAQIPATRLKRLGFELPDFRFAGWEPKELKEAYVFEEFVEARFPLVQLHQVATLGQLKEEGFTVRELRDMLLQTRTDADKLMNTMSFGAQTGNAPVPDPSLGARALRDSGCSLSDLKAGGYSVAQLHAAGYDNLALKEVEFTCSEMLFSYRVSPTELKTIGFSADDMRSSCLTMRQLKEANWSVAELASTYTIREFETGTTSDPSGGWESWKGPYSLAEVRAHFSPSDFKGARYGCMEMSLLGFTLDELREAGFPKDCSALEMHFAGFQIPELRTFGFAECLINVAEQTAKTTVANGEMEGLRRKGLKYIRALAANLLKKEPGMTLSTFLTRNGGCTYQELDKELPLTYLFYAGFDLQDMRNAGIDNCVSILLTEEECTVDELKAAGATREECETAGVAPQDMARLFGRT